MQVELLGREREQADVELRLRERPLVTIVGPGGIGKTELARHVVRGLGSDGGVDLTAISTDDAVAGAVAAHTGHPSFEALLSAPSPGFPLVIDNCEHVLTGAAAVATQLLEAGPDWQILATSRSPLNIAGESVVALGPLAAGPARELFLARARDAGTTIGLTDIEVVATIDELCHRLDGVPLAIEIAAARTRLMTPAMVLHHLSSGVEVLERPRFRGPDRHRSVRETIAWSYDLLDTRERAALDRLAVCTGPFDLDLAVSVLGAGEEDGGDLSDGDATRSALSLIDALADASLVMVAPSSPAQYRLLETVRGFALHRLDRSGQRAATEDRFVGHVVDAVSTIMGRGRAGWSAEVLNELLSTYDTVAAALALCLERDREPTRSLLLASVLWGVVHNGRVDDVAHLARQTLQRWPDPQQPFWPDAMATLATATLMLGDIDAAVAHAESALPYADASPFAPATLRRVVGLAAQSVGDHERAATTFEATAASARTSGAGAMAMEADVLRAQALSLSGRRAEALAIVRASRQEAVAGGWDVNSAFAAIVEGLVLLPTDADSAWPCLTDALQTSRAAHYPFGVTASLLSMAYAHLRDGRDEEATATILELVHEMGTSPSDWARADPLGPVAALMHRRGMNGWQDVASTVEWRARTSPLPTAGLHLVDLPAERGRILPARQATDVMLAVLSSTAPTTGSTRPASTTSPASLALDGEMWTVVYAGATAHLKRSKGMADLAQLLSRPGTDVSCLDLAGAAVEERTTGEVIDTSARRAYEDRIRELQADIDEAEAHGDAGRAEVAHAELDALVDHLTTSLGLAGRSRRHIDTTERARSAVTQRIRATIKRIDAAHPPLGAHLRSSIHTGAFASYRPAEPVDWTVRAHDVTRDLTTPG